MRQTAGENLHIFISRPAKYLRSFTIIEVVIAAAIMVAGITSIIYSYTVFMNLSHLTGSISMAAEIASAKLEDIRSDSFSDIDSYQNQVFYPQASDPYPQDIRYENLNYRGIVYVENISSNLKQVTVVICWKEGKRTIGPEWVFQTNPDPSAHPQAATPVTVTTLMTER